MKTDVLTYQKYQDISSKIFQINHTDTAIELELLEVTMIQSSVLPDGGFSLLWQGPLAPALTQATYAVQHAEIGEHPYFIVPIGKNESGYMYEAIFS